MENHEPVMEKILLDQRIGREKTQILIEGDMIVPDVKPDMAVILQTDARVDIDRAEISPDRINFIGQMEVHVLYLARGSEKPVHGMNVTAPIDDFVSMDGVKKDMWVDVRAEITNIDYKMLNDRKVSYRAVIDITAEAECQNAYDVIVNLEGIPENQLLKSKLILSRGVEKKADRFIIKDKLSIPSGKPNIREILKCSVSVSNKEVRVGNGRVTVNGELLVTTLYKGDGDSSLIEFTEHEIPFNGVIDVAGSRDDMFADVDLAIRDRYVQVRPDSDGEDRLVELEVTLGALARVHCQDTLDVLEDAYCINKTLEISKTPIRYPKLICRNKNQSPIKEIVQTEGNCPEILQIFMVKGKPVIDETKIIDDKVIVEGIIDADVLYVAQSDDTPLYSFRCCIPFRQIIETKGAAPDMDVHIAVSIDHVGFNMLSGREMELRFLLSFNTQVLQERQTNMITAIEIKDMGKDALDDMASMTVYVVQPGDSLWNIAKRYNTSIDDLLAVNELEAANKLCTGQKLLILKKICA
jgi:hypothetical protein